MIVDRDCMWTLHCTGCGASIELNAGDVRDPIRRTGRKQSMALVHAECDGFGNMEKARIALKKKRSEVLRAKTA